MLIECLIKRAGGTHVTLEGKPYHFAPTQTDDRHLADVLIQAHAERFLAISEGYRYAGEAAEEQQQGQQEQQGSGQGTGHDRMPRTSLTHAAFFEVGDNTVTLQELTLAAQRESGLSVEEWNAQEDQDLYEWLDTTLEELRDEAANEAEAARNRQAPERPAVIQPEPEEGLGDDEESEELRKAVEAEMQAKQAGGQGEEKTGTDARGDQSGEGGTDAVEKPALPSRDELSAAYKEKMGRNPSKQLSDERIYQLLQEGDE